MGHHDCLQEYNDVAMEFNGKLECLASQLKRELPGLRLLYTRTAYDTFDQIIRTPAAYGKLYSAFTNAS
jgi:hypothetical protein